MADHPSPQPADFDLATSTEADVLVVTFSGRSTEANAHAMTTRYFDLVRAAGSGKVLADIRRLRGRLSAGQTYLLVHKLPLGSLPPDLRTAILESPEQRAYAEFLETVLVNVGARVRCTIDRGEALAWLRAD
jgi:hypothetical protein